MWVSANNFEEENIELNGKDWAYYTHCPYCNYENHQKEELMQHLENQHKENSRKYIFRYILKILKEGGVSLEDDFKLLEEVREEKKKEKDLKKLLEDK